MLLSHKQAEYWKIGGNTKYTEKSIEDTIERCK